MSYSFTYFNLSLLARMEYRSSTKEELIVRFTGFVKAWRNCYPHTAQWKVMEIKNKHYLYLFGLRFPDVDVEGLRAEALNITGATS